MGKKDMEIPLAEGGPQAELHDLLMREIDLQREIDKIDAKKKEIAEMLCAEANISNITRKTLRFGVKDKPGTIVVKRMDWLEITDDKTRASIDAAKADYENKIQAFKTLHLATKHKIEAEALASGGARRVPRYYASIEGVPGASEPDQAR